MMSDDQEKCYERGYDLLDQARREKICDDIIAERLRQEQLKADGKFERTAFDDALAGAHERAHVVLAEECGEVARAICELWIELRSKKDAPLLSEGVRRILKHLRTELVQVAAVSLAWIEGIDKVLAKTE